MKKFSFFALAIAGMLFTACSDKDMAAGDGPDQGELRPDGYMSLNINLPTTPSMRAANDEFDDGDEGEYKVTDCALLLFQGTATGSEEEAVLLSAQPIVLPEGTDGVDNVTTTYQAVAKVEGYDNDGTNKLYALAMLNYRDVMSIDLSTGMPTIAGEPLTEASTFAKIRELTMMATTATLTSRGGSPYFFMTNAVLSKDKGGALGAAENAPNKTKIFQLATMANDKIFDSESEAKSKPAGEIFVERAVAKATLGYDKEKAWQVTDKFSISEVKWVIDNMEPKTYVMRNPGDLSYIGYTSGYFTINGRKANYRFVGSADLASEPTVLSEESLYRTYWCVDPQYSGNDAIGMLPTLTNNKPATPVNYVDADGTTPLYCYENTFDVPHQNYKNTTRAIIKVTLKDKDGKAPTFYTVNGNDDEVFVEQEDAESKFFEYIVINSDVVKVFKDNYVITTGDDYDITKADFEYKTDLDPVSGHRKLTSLSLSAETKKLADNKTFKEALLTDFTTAASRIIEATNDRVIIREYQKGVMYYEARFQHFAGAVNGESDLAPWNTKESWEGKVAGGKTEVAYPKGTDNRTPAENYLGRYGMVRNNWYDVTVTAFKKFGYPADPSGQVNNPDFDEPDTPDDNIVEYLSAKIHVLSWAKRDQKWGF